MSMPITGYFAEGNEIVGKFDFSFHDCTFGYLDFRTHSSQFFLNKNELLKVAEYNGWEIITPAEVEIIYRRK